MTYCEDTVIFIEKHHPNFVIPLIVFLSSTAIVATTLNFLVILTIWKTPFLQTPSRILLCSLAMTDLLVGVIVEPFFIVYCVSALVRWCDAYRNALKVVALFGYGLAAISASTLLAIAFDRCLAITTKHKYKSIVTKKRSFLVAILLWIVPGTLMATVIHFRSTSDDDTKIITILGILFVSTIVILYSTCFYYLKKLSSQVANTPNQPSSNQPSSNQPASNQPSSNQPASNQPASTDQPASDFNIWKYKRSLVTMVMVVGLILMTFLPIVIFFSTRNFSEVLNNPAPTQVCESIVILNSTLNPILCLWRMKDLRQALRNIIRV